MQARIHGQIQHHALKSVSLVTASRTLHTIWHTPRPSQVNWQKWQGILNYMGEIPISYSKSLFLAISWSGSKLLFSPSTVFNTIQTVTILLASYFIIVIHTLPDTEHLNNAESVRIVPVSEVTPTHVFTNVMYA